MRVLSLFIFTVTLAINGIAAISLAEEIKFFYPGVPSSTQHHHAGVCAMIVSFTLFFTLLACLLVKLLDSVGTFRNPPK